jgi:hypothetical protein
MSRPVLVYHATPERASALTPIDVLAPPIRIIAFAENSKISSASHIATGPPRIPILSIVDPIIDIPRNIAGAAAADKKRRLYLKNSARAFHIVERKFVAMKSVKDHDRPEVRIHSGCDASTDITWRIDSDTNARADPDIMKRFVIALRIL